MILSMFASEAAVWYTRPSPFDVLEKDIPIPGLSTLFPLVHCTSDASICQVTLGEGSINAAVSLSALIHSSTFDLRDTYFLVAAVAGISPKVSTIGSVAFPRYAVQVSLQYELDARDKPDEFPTGLIPQGSTRPDEFPRTLYGTEVFELNEGLRQASMDFARKATLNDTSGSQAVRAKYSDSPLYVPATRLPEIIGCDSATSDTFWSGRWLAEAFENTTSLFTGGKGQYCITQQEDNAVLEVLLRMSKSGLTDFERVVIMRTCSDFDRPYDGQTASDNLFRSKAGFIPALENIWLAGVEVVSGIVDDWDTTFQRGLAPSNHVGSILDGPPSYNDSLHSEVAFGQHLLSRGLPLRP